MFGFLLLLCLTLPLLLVGYQWYNEEYIYTRKMLSYRQCILLSCFVCYSAFCFFGGVDSTLHQLNDLGYKAGRALSFTGMWGFVMPGLIAPLIIFPRETLLYLFRQPHAGDIETIALATFGWALLLCTLGRHLLVI